MLKAKLYLVRFTFNAYWEFNLCAPEYSNDLLPDKVLRLLKLKSVTLCLVTVPNEAYNVQCRMIVLYNMVSFHSLNSIGRGNCNLK